MTDIEEDTAAPQRVVLVTGASGAGRSTATRVLEDLGFEAIDNLPLSLVPRLFDGGVRPQPIALGIDARNREFSEDAFLDLYRSLSARPGYAVEVLFLDCRPDVLVRRYSETRRRHPLAPDESPDTGIQREVAHLAGIRAEADVLLDTSDLTVHDCRAELSAIYGARDAQLTVTVHSFSYKRGLPRGIDMAFDVRFLANPHWVPELRPLDGRDPRVVAHVAADPRCAPFYDRVLDLTRMLLPAYLDEGKTHFAVAFGCTGGQHRSVAVAERLASDLVDSGWRVSIRHRELERRPGAQASASTVGDDA